MSAFYEGLAEIFEVEAEEITPQFDLVAHNWDSLAIISTIALIDECFNEMVDGSALMKCVVVADVERLIGVAAAA
jgi:acyl carrier protein